MSVNNVEFKEPGRLTTWIKYLLYVQVALALIAIGSNLMEYQLLTDFQNGVYSIKKWPLQTLRPMTKGSR